MDNNNPFLRISDPFEPQREKEDKVKKELIEFQRLCFEVFHMHKDGIKLYELIKERYITRSLFAPTQPNASELALYYEGFKEALRGLWNQGRTHQMRINGEFNS